MAVVHKSVEQVVLKAFRKFKTGYESPKEKQLAFIIGILEYENVFVCLICGPDFEKKYITAASPYLPYAFDISPDAKSGHSLVLCVLEGHPEVTCEVTF